jgi:hypothetical protein
MMRAGALSFSRWRRSMLSRKRRQVVDRPGQLDAVLRQLPCFVHRAGVVDEHIQLWIAGQHLGGQSAHRGLRREVGDECRHRRSPPGSIRRECVDHIVALGETHLRRVLKSYARYYNEMRTHRSLDKDAPISRPVQRTGNIISHALLGWTASPLRPCLSFRYTQGYSDAPNQYLDCASYLARALGHHSILAGRTRHKERTYLCR